MRKEIHLNIELGISREYEINLCRLPHPCAMEVNLLEKMGAYSLQAIIISHNPSRKYMEDDSVHLMSYTASFP